MSTSRRFQAGKSGETDTRFVVVMGGALEYQGLTMKTLGVLLVLLTGVLQAAPGGGAGAPVVVKEDDPKPLPGLVLQALEKHVRCEVELTVDGAGMFTLNRWDLKKATEVVPNLRPLVITVGKEVEINTGPATELLSMPELKQRLRMYEAALEGGGGQAVIRIRLDRHASDLLFRQILYALKERDMDDHVYAEKFRRESKPKPGLDPRMQRERFRHRPKP